MRVVAGSLRSRKIEAVEGMNTRPTADKVKEAIFSRIGPYFQGGCMLDVYSGSGNIAIEALSRGMDKAWLNDKSREAVKTMKQNVQNLKLESITVITQLDAELLLDKCAEKDYQFDLIYLDPPYALQRNEKLIEKICALSLIKEDGLILVESRKEDVFPEKISEMVLEKAACYGITKISYYRRETKR